MVRLPPAQLEVPFKPTPPVWIPQHPSGGSCLLRNKYGWKYLWVRLLTTTSRSVAKVHRITSPLSSHSPGEAVPASGLISLYFFHPKRRSCPPSPCFRVKDGHQQQYLPSGLIVLRLYYTFLNGRLEKNLQNHFTIKATGWISGKTLHENVFLQMYSSFSLGLRCHRIDQRC